MLSFIVRAYMCVGEKSEDVCVLEFVSGVYTRVASHKGEALLCAPQGGFLLDEFSKSNLPWVLYLD